jgi:hypothetical protein
MDKAIVALLMDDKELDRIREGYAVLARKEREVLVGK